MHSLRKYRVAKWKHSRSKITVHFLIDNTRLQLERSQDLDGHESLLIESSAEQVHKKISGIMVNICNSTSWHM